MLSTPSLYYFQDLAYANQNPRIFTQIQDQDLSNRGIGLICRRPANTIFTGHRKKQS